MSYEAVCLFILTILFYAYAYVKNSYTYWKRRNIQQTNPKFPYGDLGGSKKQISEVIRDLYLKYSGQTQFVGAYFFIEPVVIVLCPDLVKQIFISDSKCFSKCHSEPQPDHSLQPVTVSAHLLSLHNKQFSKIRAILNKNFTEDKTKLMFNQIYEIFNEMVHKIKHSADTKSIIEINSVFMKYAFDSFIATTFGFKIENNDCSNCIQKIFASLQKNHLRIAFANVYPKLSQKLNIPLIDKEAIELFFKITRNAMKHHKNEKNRKNTKGHYSLESLMDQTDDENTNETTIQSILFFVAGIEASVKVMQYCLNEMANNQKIQDKARNEILMVLRKNNGRLCFENLKELSYLEKCIKGLFVFLNS